MTTNKFFPIIVALTLSMTFPGIDANISVYLGPFTVKILAGFFLFFNIKNLKLLRTNKFIFRIIICLILFIFYRLFNSTIYSVNNILPFVSFLWMIIIITSFRTFVSFNHLIFISFIFSAIIFFSESIDVILDFNRDFTKNRAETGLEGISYSYIIYVQNCFMFFALAFYYFRSKKNIILKILLASLLLLITIAIITSGSRGGLISFAFSLIFYVYIFPLFNNSSKIKLKSILIASLFIIICLSYYSSLFTSIIESFNEDDISYGYRLYALNTSIEYFLQSPLIGNGWDSVRGFLDIPPHSNLFQILGELGIIGLIFELIIYYNLYKLLKQNFKLLKDVNNNLNKLLIIKILFSLLAGLLFWGLFENTGYIIGNRLLYIITSFLFTIIIINSKKIFTYSK